jgi:hypothetical protein
MCSTRGAYDVQQMARMSQGPQGQAKSLVSDESMLLLLLDTPVALCCAGPITMLLHVHVS